MISQLTQTIHIFVIVLSTFTLLKGFYVYIEHSYELSRTMNKFLLYANLITFLILTTDLYRLTIDTAYVGGWFSVYAYLTQVCMVLLSRNLIKTAKQLALDN
jgi:hypothetical protein